MGRTPCSVVEYGLKKGRWKPQEDQKLLAYIQQHGHGRWRSLPQKAGLQRCGKSCRLRWNNYLRPDIKRGNFSLQEERTIIQLHALLGNRWSVIAAHLPMRTDNDIKNYWNTHLKKRLAKMGIDPVTHKPISTATTLGSAKNVSVLSHMAQWESARLEAEGRLRKESQLLQHEPSSSASAKQLNKLVTTPLAPPRRLDVLKAWQSIISNPIEEGGGSGRGCGRGGGSGNGGCFGFDVGGDYDNIDSPTFTFSGVFGGNNNNSIAAGSGSNIIGEVHEIMNKNYWNDDLFDIVNAGVMSKGVRIN